MQSDPYASIVALYDLEHANFSDDIDLFIQLAELGDGRILELGCGTGRVLIPLASQGHATVGIDASQPMLDVCRARAAEHNVDIDLHCGDMADPAAVPGAPFGLILASLNSIMHLEATSQRRMLRSAYDALGSGGRLVLDTLNPGQHQLNHLLNVTHLEGSWTLADGSTVDKWGHRKAGEESQVIDTLIWYDRVGADGSFQRERTQFSLRYVHQSELALLLDLAGFTIVDWYGSYELDPWDPESDRILAVAHKDNA